MPNPADRLENRIQLRKLEMELGHLFGRVGSALAGLQECLAQSLRKSGREDPIATLRVAEQHAAQVLVDVLSAELQALRPPDAPDQALIEGLLERTRTLLVESEQVARGVFATGALCNHSRNMLYRLKSRRYSEHGLSIERIRELSNEATSVEQHLAVLHFCIRSDRRFEDALRMIHPRSVQATESAAEEGA